jgi:hypothetical protein
MIDHEDFVPLQPALNPMHDSPGTLPRPRPYRRLTPSSVSQPFTKVPVQPLDLGALPVRLRVVTED